MTTRKTLGSVYSDLQQAGYIDSELEIQNAGYDTQNDSPWFIQGLMGCGGWIAAVFMIGVVGSCIGTFLVNLDPTVIGFFLLILGAIFAGATTSIKRSGADSGVFLTQLLLTVHVAGHLMLIGGFVMAFEMYNSEAQQVITMLYIIILQSIFIYLYPDSIYRFLAMLLISSALAWIAFILELPIIISISTGILMFLALLVWMDKLPEEWQIHYLRMLHPVGYGAMIGAFGLMIYEVTNRYWYYDYVPANTAFITTIIVFVFLIAILKQLLEEYGNGLTTPFALTIFGIATVVTIPVYATPGILAGIVGILLAFRRRNRILLGIAYIYMTGFIIYYYYWLDVTLLTKSIILMVTGILLIAARFFLHRVVTVPDLNEGEVA